MPSGRDPALGPLGAVGKLRMMPMKPQGSSHKAGNPPWVQRASAEGKAGETVMRREAWPTALQGLPCLGRATHLCGASLTQGPSMAQRAPVISSLTPPPPFSSSNTRLPCLGTLCLHLLPEAFLSHLLCPVKCHPDHRAAPSRDIPVMTDASHNRAFQHGCHGPCGAAGHSRSTSVTEELNF